MSGTGGRQRNRRDRRTPRAAGRERGQPWYAGWRSQIRPLTVVLGGLALAAVVAFALALAAPGRSTADKGAGAGDGGTTAPQWATLPAASPTNVLQAVESSSFYQQIRSSATTLLGDTLQHATLGTPVLVRVYHPAPGQYDVYVVPVLQGAAGSGGQQQVVALLDVAYDAKGSRITPLSIAGPFAAGDPEYQKPFPRFSADQARARFAAAHVAAMAAGTAPALIYFPADLARINDPRSSQKWTTGGQFPDLAVWLIRGADGHDYVVGLDGQVVAASSLPFAPNASS